MIWNKKERKNKRADTKKQATGFTLLLIPNSSDSAKTIEITYDRLLQLLTGAVAAAIIVIGLMCSMVYHNRKLKASIAETEASVSALKETNASLEATVSQLNDQISADKEAFSKIEDTITKKEEEEAANAEQAAVPNEIPIKNANAILVEDPYKDSEGRTMGIVFSTLKGAAVAATADGTVTHVDSDEENPFYTRGIVIDHENGYITYYRMNGDVSIEEGVKVSKGDVMAVLTDDGYVAYEIKADGSFIDPRTMIQE
ncbi:MAG: peptidoglycan DD-metalloendopeptidase family protein [Lachnospiraceae bacterium]|nr:peptidoglycan DD-metalloendopeptidase family protein [Lachnospiraceae bacterium]